MKKIHNLKVVLEKEILRSFQIHKPLTSEIENNVPILTVFNVVGNKTSDLCTNSKNLLLYLKVLVLPEQLHKWQPNYPCQHWHRKAINFSRLDIIVAKLCLSFTSPRCEFVLVLLEMNFPNTGTSRFLMSIPWHIWQHLQDNADRNFLRLGCCTKGYCRNEGKSLKGLHT